jgi:hypothetical protein
MTHVEIITHADAKAQGLKRFFTGVACNKGHVAERLTSNPRMCVECKRIYRARERTAPTSKPIKTARVAKAVRASGVRVARKTVAAPVAESAPAAYEPEKSLHRDPGQRISQARVAAFIDRIYAGSRLGVSEAA